MLHHVELYVRDLERSITFWTPFMALLGYAGERWGGGVTYLAASWSPTSRWCRRRPSTSPPATTAGGWT
jgi:catechol 2,3-dioxygenase-like lactoylglutathione lyase family enzyme